MQEMSSEVRYKRNRGKRIWRKCVSAMACIVVFCVTYALILPAITLEKDTFCGIPAHVHEDACYSGNVMVCDPAADTGLPVLHTHDAFCYDGEELICPLAERSGHVHTDACYETVTIEAHTHDESCSSLRRGELKCELTEEAGHTHGDDCLVPGETLICTEAEREGHSHTEGCYSVGSELTCTAEEGEGHSHTEACYSVETTLTCAEDHEHGEDCYTQTQTLVCAIPETPAHTHGDGCYTEVTTLICEIPEDPGHTHVDTCYEQVLDCGLEEKEGHTHEDACFEMVSELTCGREEIPETVIQHNLICGKEQIAPHTHDSGCSDENGNLICTIQNAVPHQHTEACIQPARTEENLICGLQVHEHTLICYSDPTADLETAQDWEKTFAELELSGDWRRDVVALAKTQLGYEESTKNYIVEDGNPKGYTRYGDWYGIPYGDWCAMFVSFCLDYAGVEDMPLDCNCPNWIRTLTEAKRYYSRDDYVPLSGDLIFFDWNGDGSSDHVGLVAEYIPATEDALATVRTIEGNSGNCVKYNGYAPNDTTIMGYGALPVQLTEEEQAQVDAVIAMIDAMPASEEIEAQLLAYEESEDMEAYEAYFKTIGQQGQRTYQAYLALGEELQAYVTNVDRLMDSSWLWSMVTLDIKQGIDVLQINTCTTANGPDTTLLRGKSASNLSSTHTYEWWSAIVVEERSDGTLYVSQVINSQGDKRAYGPSTENGFVLLVWSGTIRFEALDVSPGDAVSVSFDYTQTGTYTGTSYGTVTFSDGNFKSNKNNSKKLDIVQGADTNELIEVNLYDYGDNINTLYSSNGKYPGYQQDNGSTNVGSAFNQYQSFNFGNNITADLAAGLSNVTVKDGTTINATASTYGGVAYGYANIPVSGKMLPTLKDNYPALADGTSLDYLFSTGTYATKQNTGSINGLFQHNPVTGAYTFNSRENHAQFDSETDTFTLYKQIISSNFIMYPFGNFLPFNDITEKSAQASTIDRAYLVEIANSAQYKADGGYNQTANDEYGTLATQLKKFISLMDAKYGTGWDAYDAVNQYFISSNLPATFSESSPQLRDGEALMDYIYSIDYDEETDFYFGMDMKMTFMQPKDGLTGNDTNGDGAPDYPMIFYFTGDDDVWVYIDDVLFLDLSGIHRHVGGEIDFVNGLVKYYVLDPASGDVAGEPYKTVSFAEILGSTNGLSDAGTFANYSTHTFNFYYMERGAGSGVCRMNFNFPLLRKDSISVGKEISSDTGIQGNPDYKFQVLKADSNGNKTSELFIAAGTTYTVYDEKDIVIGTGTTDANGVFTLKAGQRAEFSEIKENAGKYYVRELLEGTVLEQYGNVTVSGESTTTSNNVTVGSDSFTGMDSPIKDMSDGATAFRFINDVDETKVGTLNISKKLTEYPKTREIKYYDIEVSLDGKKLPVGTVYTVGGQTRTVETAGIITIAAEETATISNILAGTVFTVQETSGSAEGYTVTYDDSGGYAITVNDGVVSGVIKTSANVQLVVTNSENGTSVTIPGTKRLRKSDGAEHTYTFTLTEVTDTTGTTEKADGISGYEATATITEGTENFRFTINYTQVEQATLPVTYYYRISENSVDGNFADVENYVAEVTVSEAADGISAALTGMWKDGVKIETLSADFVNTITGNLKLTKIVNGSTEAQTGDAFSFTITLDPGDSGVELKDKYPVTVTQADGETFNQEWPVTDGVMHVNEFHHGEAFMIHDLPIGTTWNIEETLTDGYKVQTAITVGETTTDSTGTETNGIIVAGDTSVVYINQQFYELPETGGTGTYLYTMAGLLLMLTSTAYLLYRYRKRRREVY